MMPAKCCSVDFYGAELETVSQTTMRRARVRHACSECGGSINPDERYEDHSGLVDGEWFRVRTCAPCLGIRRDFFPGGWIYGELVGSFRECMGWDYREVEVTEGRREP